MGLGSESCRRPGERRDPYSPPVDFARLFRPMTTEPLYYVYILASGHHGTLYIGVTNDLGKRLVQHRTGRGSRFASKYKVNQLVYVETYPTAMEAIAREKQLKNWRRDWKIELIERDNLDWSDLSGLICGL
jgi:putative endonuclease